VPQFLSACIRAPVHGQFHLRMKRANEGEAEECDERTQRAKIDHPGEPTPFEGNVAQQMILAAYNGIQPMSPFNFSITASTDEHWRRERACPWARYELLFGTAHPASGAHVHDEWCDLLWAEGSAVERYSSFPAQCAICNAYIPCACAGAQ
jgi:hypothetical protein